MTAPLDRRAGVLLRETYAILRAYWVIALPFVLLGLVTGTGSPGRPMATMDETPSVDEVLRLLPFFAILGVLALLAFLLGLVLLVVPAFIVLSALFPLMVIVVAEGKGGGAALSRAWDVTRGERMPLFLVLLAGIGVDVAASILLGWIPIVGGGLVGVVSGLVSVGYAVAAALGHHRKVEGPASSAPPLAAVPPAAPG